MSANAGLLILIVIASVALVMLVSWRIRTLARWRMRARSAKVLDEIEMEFVNDDVDMFVLEDEREDQRLCADLTGLFYRNFLHVSVVLCCACGNLTRVCCCVARRNRRGPTSSTWGSERSAPL